jgi:hypothetical protein
MFQYVSTVTGLQFVLEETGAKSFVELPYHAFPHRGDSVHEIPLATFEVRVGRPGDYHNPRHPPALY